MQISKAEIEQKYNSMRTQDLAKELGVSLCTLVNTLKKAGIPLKGNRKKVFSKKKLEII